MNKLGTQNTAEGNVYSEIRYTDWFLIFGQFYCSFSIDNSYLKFLFLLLFLFLLSTNIGFWHSFNIIIILKHLIVQIILRSTLCVADDEEMLNIAYWNNLRNVFLNYYNLRKCLYSYCLKFFSIFAKHLYWFIIPNVSNTRKIFVQQTVFTHSFNKPYFWDALYITKLNVWHFKNSSK